MKEKMPKGYKKKKEKKSMDLGRRYDRFFPLFGTDLDKRKDNEL